MSGFDREKYIGFQHEISVSLGVLADSIAREMPKRDYMEFMAFGVGATAASNIIREALESNREPSASSMSVEFAASFFKHAAHREYLEALYDERHGDGR